MLIRYPAMPVRPEDSSPKEIMPEGPFYILFVFLLLSSAFLFAGCIGIIRQGNYRYVPHGTYGSGVSQVISREHSPHVFWAAVVLTGALGAILLILDLWMLVRHRRAKQEAE